MKLCVVLLILVLASVALAKKNKGSKKICIGNGGTLRMFNKRREGTKMPCKFNAVHQTCGQYEVKVTPGHLYLHPRYHLDSLWVDVLDTSSNQRWMGRTDNKLAVKYYNGWNSDLFMKKGGALDSNSLFTFGRNGKTNWARTKDFIITFQPWDPDSKKYATAKWTFECKDKKKNFAAASYPEQICGGDEKQELAERYQELGLESREMAIYYDVFTNTRIVQSNSKCTDATDIMVNMCTEDQRRMAINTCSQILSSPVHTKCVTKYSCDPMDVFVDCLAWVCSDYQDTGACERVGRGIDMCRDFNQGGLSGKVAQANCYKDFLVIET